MSNLEEQLKMELDIHLEEYRVRMSSMQNEINAIGQTFGLTITGIGFVLAASPFIVQNRLPHIFVVAGFVFYGLTLIQIRHSWTIFAIESYVNNVLRFSIQSILNQIDSQNQRNVRSIFLWSSFYNRSAYAKHWWQFPIEAARYLIPLVAGVVCCIAYYLVPGIRSLVIDIGIGVANLLAVSYVVLVGLSSRRQFSMTADEQRSLFSYQKYTE